MKRIIFSATIFLTLMCLFAAKVVAQQAPTQQQLQSLLQAAQQQQAAAANNPPVPVVTQAQIVPTVSAPTPLPPPAEAAAPAPNPTAVTANAPAPVINSVDTGGDIGEEAFATMTQAQLPMSPNQIRTLHKLFDQTQRAVGEYPGVPPRPTSSSIAVSLAPGATPPIVRLQAGFVTSLVFVDATGAPWPIHAIDIGDPSGFDVQWDKKSNTLLVQAITQYKAANLAVQLEGLNTPVMITLMPGQAAVDYRVDFHVPGLGPNAFPFQTGLPGTGNMQLLLNVLSGIPPNGSKQMEVIPSGYADVWMYNGQFYVRTLATVLSPAWMTTMSSSDGTHAYKMPITPLIIVSLNGKPINLSIAGY